MDNNQLIEQLTKDFIIEYLKERNIFYMNSSQLEKDIDRHVHDALVAASLFNKSLHDHVEDMNFQ